MRFERERKNGVAHKKEKKGAKRRKYAPREVK